MNDRMRYFVVVFYADNKYQCVAQSEFLLVAENAMYTFNSLVNRRDIQLNELPLRVGVMGRIDFERLMDGSLAKED